jgi:membrane protein
MTSLLSWLLRAFVGVSILRRAAAGGPAAPVPAPAGALTAAPLERRRPVVVRLRRFLRAVVARIRRCHVPDAAAALTYYIVMALVPSALVVLAVVGLVADPEQLYADLVSFFNLDPSSTFATALHGFLEILTSPTSGGAPALIGFGTVVALWSFSGAMAAIMTTINRIWERPERRNYVVKRLIALAMAIGTALVALGGVVAIGLAGGFADRIAKKADLGGIWTWVLTIGPFVGLFVLLTLYLAVVYWVSPEKGHRSWHWLSTGAIVAVVIWVLATIGFSVYVSTFASYSKVYGKLATPVIALFWVYLSSLAILVGAAVDAELESSRRG